MEVPLHSVAQGDSGREGWDVLRMERGHGRIGCGVTQPCVLPLTCWGPLGGFLSPTEPQWLHV